MNQDEIRELERAIDEITEIAQGFGLDYRVHHQLQPVLRFPAESQRKLDDPSQAGEGSDMGFVSPRCLDWKQKKTDSLRNRL